MWIKRNMYIYVREQYGRGLRQQEKVLGFISLFGEKGQKLSLKLSTTHSNGIGKLYAKQKFWGIAQCMIVDIIWLVTVTLRNLNPL